MRVLAIAAKLQPIARAIDRHRLFKPRHMLGPHTHRDNERPPRASSAVRRHAAGRSRVRTRIPPRRDFESQRHHLSRGDAATATPVELTALPLTESLCATTSAACVAEGALKLDVASLCAAAGYPAPNRCRFHAHSHCHFRSLAVHSIRFRCDVHCRCDSCDARCHSIHCTLHRVVPIAHRSFAHHHDRTHHARQNFRLSIRSSTHRTETSPTASMPSACGSRHGTSTPPRETSTVVHTSVFWPKGVVQRSRAGRRSWTR